MSAHNSQFIQTRDLFREYLSGYFTKGNTLTFDQWKNADAEDQAALLFVVFYQEITLAWYDAIVSRDIVYVEQDDGVSVVLEKLMKNVPKILADPKRYDPKYIYRVSYNCIGCLPRPVGAKARAASEMSNEYTEDDITMDLFDFVPTPEADYDTQETLEAMWDIIQHMGLKAEKVANHLITGDSLLRVNKNSTERSIDRLADVTVSPSEFKSIVAELKVKLAPFREAMLAG